MTGFPAVLFIIVDLVPMGKINHPKALSFCPGFENKMSWKWITIYHIIRNRNTFPKREFYKKSIGQNPVRSNCLRRRGTHMLSHFRPSSRPAYTDPCHNRERRWD